MLKKIGVLFDLVKFPHSIFALPFALISMFVASGGLPPWRIILWILVAMVSARNVGMAYNRFVDRDIDEINPRTAHRPLPKGKISPTDVRSFIIINCIIFIFSAYMLNKLVFFLSPLALFIICFYSHTKRFTSFTHFFLGLALGISPIGAWLAVNGGQIFDEIVGFIQQARFVDAWIVAESDILTPMILGLAVLFWVAGFDIIYSCLDRDFDKRHDLKSLVTLLDIPKALIVSKICHVLTIFFLLWFGNLAGLGWLYISGVFIFAIGLMYEHLIVKPNDLSKADFAFFNVNAIISVILVFSVCFDLFIVR